MRVLLIAPAMPDLPDAAVAVQAIASLHQCEILQAADTTQREIVDKASRQQFDIIVLFGHLSGGGGFALNDGELSVEVIVSIVQVSGAGLVVLAICRSWAIAQQISARTGADCIFTLADTWAQDAMLVMMVLARQLTRVQSFRAAFEAASPGDTWMYSENYRQRITEAMIADPNPSNQLDRLYAMTDQIRRDVASIDRTVALPEQTVQQLQRDVSEIGARLTTLENPSADSRIYGVSRSALLLVLLSTLMFGLALYVVATR